nr:hypothetical protein [Tanacetum cinerariifolium]
HRHGPENRRHNRHEASTAKPLMSAVADRDFCHAGRSGRSSDPPARARRNAATPAAPGVRSATARTADRCRASRRRQRCC